MHLGGLLRQGPTESENAASVDEVFKSEDHFDARKIVKDWPDLIGVDCLIPAQSPKGAIKWANEEPNRRSR